MSKGLSDTSEQKLPVLKWGQGSWVTQKRDVLVSCVPDSLNEKTTASENESKVCFSFWPSRDRCFHTFSQGHIVCNDGGQASQLCPLSSNAALVCTPQINFVGIKLPCSYQVLVYKICWGFVF